MEPVVASADNTSTTASEPLNEKKEPPHMSDTDTSTPQAAGEPFDWNTYTVGDSSVPMRAEPAARAYPGQQGCASGGGSPFVEGTRELLGSMPIECDTAIAVMHLPEPVKCVHCASVFVNSGILSDCDRDYSRRRPPVIAMSGQPGNDGEIVIFTDARGNKVTEGDGWVPGDYPGSAPKLRPIETGQPYVEVLVKIGRDCGPCMNDKFVPNDQYP